MTCDRQCCKTVEVSDAPRFEELVTEAGVDVVVCRSHAAVFKHEGQTLTGCYLSRTLEAPGAVVAAGVLHA